MRHILYSLLAIALVSSSCQKKVLDLTPQDLESTSSAYSTPSKIKAAVLAGYDGLQSYEFLSGRALVYVDIMGGDVFDRQTFFGDIPRFSMLANNTIAENVWTAGYAAIADANRALAGMAANSSILSADDYKDYVAECKFVRAVANFYLVNFFAQTYVYTADASHPGIPIITQSFAPNDPAANQPRSSVAAVYTAILKDLTDALPDIPVTYGDAYDDKTRGTKASVSAFLSRVYLYMGDYANAKKYAGDVIAQTYGTFTLLSDPHAVFDPTNGYTTDETVWSIPNSANDNPNTNNALPMHYYPTGRADLPLTPAFQDSSNHTGSQNPYFAPDDLRRTMIIPGSALTTTTQFKFTNKYTDVTNRADWAPIIRYPELLLTYAEAEAHLNGVDADALDKLNQVRDRSRVSAPQYTLASFASKTDLINAILGERRIELAFEGHRFWDLMRNKLPVTHRYEDGVHPSSDQPYGDPKDVFPIPQVEIDKSKGVLKQNPGY